jgi:hypothetical protein
VLSFSAEFPCCAEFSDSFDGITIDCPGFDRIRSAQRYTFLDIRAPKMAHKRPLALQPLRGCSETK